MQPRHFGSNLNQPKKFSAPFDPAGYNYLDYIDAWTKIQAFVVDLLKKQHCLQFSKLVLPMVELLWTNTTDISRRIPAVQQTIQQQGIKNSSRFEVLFQPRFVMDLFMAIQVWKN